MEDKKKGHATMGASTNQQHNSTKKEPTQVELLLNEFEKGNKVSNAEAIIHLSIGHLASVISYMRIKLGIKGIVMTDEVSKNGRKYVAYSMSKEDVVKARELLRTN